MIKSDASEIIKLTVKIDVFFPHSGRPFNPQTMAKRTGELQSILGKVGFNIEKSNMVDVLQMSMFGWRRIGSDRPST